MITMINYTEGEKDMVIICVNGKAIGTCVDDKDAIALFKEQMSK